MKNYQSVFLILPMFFILSKLLYFLLIPFNWIIILLISIYCIKSHKLKRRLTLITVFITLIFTNPWLYKTATKYWQADFIELSKVKQYELGILLTGMVQFDTRDQGFFGSPADRFIQTATLYHTGKIKKILVTGGSGSLLHTYKPEAVFLKEMLVNNEIPEQDIIVEPDSRNTYENALFSKRIVDSLQINTPSLLITSALHMRRSEAVFRKAGIQFDSYPADFRVIDDFFSVDNTLLPDAKLLKDWSQLIKEVIGLWVYQLTGKA